jgi:hypothetical protein
MPTEQTEGRMSFVKTPAGVLEYRFDWAVDGWLAEDETITESEIIADPGTVEEPGITVDSDTNDTTSATVWLSGGTEWERYEVTNRITTSMGRVDDRTIRIYVQQR